MMKFERDSRYNRFILNENDKKSKEQIASESKKSPEEKVDMMIDGKRDINFKACSPDKLRNYYRICLDKEFDKGIREIEKVAKSRNIDLDNDVDESCSKYSFNKGLYRQLMNGISERLFEDVDDELDKKKIDWAEIERRLEADKEKVRLKRMTNAEKKALEKESENAEKMRIEQQMKKKAMAQIIVPPIDYYKPIDKDDLKTYIHKIISKYCDKKRGFIKIDLNFIDVSEISDMSHLFIDIDDIFFDISRWDVSNVHTMRSMFMGCHDFNCDISSWDVSNVRDMRSMFANCTSFNQPIGSWDVSNVIMMTNMFRGCITFNCSLKDWDVTNVKEMNGMFAECDNYNQPMDWDVRGVYNMSYMFYRCSNFNQNLSNWIINGSCDIDHMFDYCRIRSDYRPRRGNMNESIRFPHRHWRY